MISFTIDKKHDNKKILSVILELYPNFSYSLLRKALRKKDIRINNTRINSDIYVNSGDIITVYLNYDESIDFNINYEDENILIANKPQGIEVIDYKKPDSPSLLTSVKKYLNDAYVYPLHRLDRNTGGLVIFAKAPEILAILEDKLKNNEIEKYYLCTVLGKPPKKEDTLTDYLFKDSKKSQVYVSSTPQKGYQKIITKYKVLHTQNNFSKLEIKLITGKTHQIRAHLAHIGCPILGDGKYGINEINKKYHKKYQELFAYKVVFNFSDTVLGYLNQKEFAIPDLELFPWKETRHI